MILYTLPDFTNGLQLNLFFAQLQKSDPNVFLDGVRIGSIYGCFPSCIANGGRVQGGTRWSREQIETLYSIVDDAGLATRLTLTNLLLEERHLEDEYLGLVLASARGHAVEAIVANDVLDSYIRGSFPSMPRILSTTREILGLEELDRATIDFDYVVLDYRLHRDYDFIGSIKQPEKVEVMVNEYCSADCPRRQHHYLENSRNQLSGEMKMYPCVQERSKGFVDELMAHNPNHPVRLTTDDVRVLHDKFGISNFKIVGRGMAAAIVLKELLYYLIKPEYRLQVENAIVRLGLVP